MKQLGQWNSSLSALRLRAERSLDELSFEHISDQGNRMLRELRLHEIELRMQNDELLQLCDEVHTSNERYADLFMSAPVAYFVLDQQSRVVHANMAAAELVGATPALIEGVKLSSFVASDHAEAFVRHMRAVLQSAGPHKTELTLRVADGSVRDVRIESSRDARRSNEWRAAIIDLTEVRRLERDLQRSRSLEAMGTFAASVAHDFGNLLNLISMGVDLALEIDGQPEAAKSPLTRIQRAVREGRRMVRQMMRFSSDEAVHDARDVEGFSLDAAVSGVEHELRRQCGDKVQLDFKLAAASAVIKLDLGAPSEILLNLAANALHAMPDGGHLFVETSLCAAPSDLETVPPGTRFVVLRVKDTGRGMDAGTLARAFEPFFTTRRGSFGTGLGLAMVHRIVTRAGGRITLESALGKGTTVSIFLPAAPEAALTQAV